MHKQSQSLLDFINFFPLQSIQVERSPLNNKEAQSLYSLWKGDRDNYGNIIVPEDIDSMAVAALTSKGMVKGKLGGMSIGNKRILEITKRGKEIIKNIILHNETSAFEKESNSLDYESIHRLTANPTMTTATKVASKQIVETNWLQRVLWKSF